LLLRPCIFYTITFPHIREIVDPAVQLDQEFRAQIGEVEDLWADGRLSAEVCAFDCAEMLPETLFGRCRFAAQALGAGVGFRKVSLAIRQSRGLPPLRPSPQGGGVKHVATPWMTFPALRTKRQT